MPYSDISKQMEYYKKQERKNLEETLEKIRCGECTPMNYFEVFTAYQSLQKNKKEYEAEIKKYGDLVLETAKTDSDQENANACAAYVYAYYKNKEQALFHINKAISLNPQNAEFYIVRARIYYEFKMKKEAEADYAKAITLSPELEEYIKLLKDTDKLIEKTNPLLFLIIFIFLLVLAIFLIFFQ